MNEVALDYSSLDEDLAMSTSAPTSNVGGPVTPANDDVLYEVVNGQIVELPPMGAFEASFASLIHNLLGPFVQQNGLGRAVVEVLFLLDANSVLKRRPDVAFVSFDRWPRKRRIPRGDAWEVVPDLAIEVVSQSNTAEEILTKVREYFAAGARRVWVFYPHQEQVYDYTSPTKNIILTRAEELDGGDVVRGFRLPLDALYEDGDE